MDSKKKGKAIMVLGTTSDAGKSITALALCRILNNLGYSVCPFKSQNMSLNAKVTADGHEISMIQDLQCHAARIDSTYRVNPILLKPTSDMKSQVIVEGKIFGVYDVDSYYSDFIPNHSFSIVKNNIDYLLNNYDFVIMEGAGSPAEINIYEKDIANMRAAEIADADCILVVNTEWGGSIAYVLGTIMLMPENDRKRIKGIIYNNLRGNPIHFKDAAKAVEDRTGIPTLGIIPHISNQLPQEDSEFFRSVNEIGEGDTVIGVIRTPRISNFTDIDPLYGEDVLVKFLTEPNQIDMCNAIIIPGTKNSISDMKWMKEKGFDKKIKSVHGKIPILGICGGYQMLGKSLKDPYGNEDPTTKEIEGLGLLNLETNWNRSDKVTVRSKGTFIKTGEEVTGYQIHVGRSDTKEAPLFELENEKEGSMDEKNLVFGTYLHGVLEKPSFRKYFLSLIDPNLPKKSEAKYEDNLDNSISLIADGFKENLDKDTFYKLFGGKLC